MTVQPPIRRVALAIAVAGCVSQVVWHWVLRGQAIDGVYFQSWSSEHMVQTVSILDLKEAPLQSLWNLHIQPPMLDAIRAVLAQCWSGADPQMLLRHVDQSLYVIWAALYGILGALIFVWLSALTRFAYAVGAAIVFLLHPAAVFYATLLETTLLSSVLILWMSLELWRLRNHPAGSLVPFSVSVVALFFTRSLFQWPSVLVFAVGLALARVSPRRVAMFLLVIGTVTGLYLVKQYVKFGLLTTSSITGLSLTHAAGMPDTAYYQAVEHADRARVPADLPGVLARPRKLDGTPNLNHVSYLASNGAFLAASEHHVLDAPLRDTLRTYRNSLWLYLLPSDWFELHPISERLPWRSAYNAVFSAPVLPALLLVAGIVWWVRARRAGYGRADYLADLALAVPALYIAVVSVVGDVGENMRFKFFLEPVLFVFLASHVPGVGATPPRIVRPAGDRSR